jgi:DedD protein
VDEVAGEKVKAMASNARRGGGDRVLESRHLVGLFLGVVLLCGVFFTLGYVMGRTQYGGAVHAADGFNSNVPSASVSPKSRTAPAAKNAPATAPDNGGWDFYDNKKSASDHLEPAPAPATAAASAPATKAPTSVPAVAAKSNNTPPPAATKTVAATPKQPPARFQAPAMGKSSIVLQVAAVKLQRDALEMADAIQQKKFPAFVATSPADNFLHVQVGPYPDMAAAENAKRALEQLGFKPIIKH